MGRRPQPVRDRVRVVSIGDGPWLSNKLPKIWRVHVWESYMQKTSFRVQLLIGLIPSQKESLNFWHVSSQLRTTLYWNQIVLDRQGSAAHKIPNHLIFPSLTCVNDGWILQLEVTCLKITQRNSRPSVTYATRVTVAQCYHESPLFKYLQISFMISCYKIWIIYLEWNWPAWGRLS